MHHRIAGTLTGRVTKWIVLAVWVVVLGVSAGFAGQPIDVQNNEASSWLPASAESTRALEQLAPVQDENDIPTVVVYVRAIAVIEGVRGRCTVTWSPWASTTTSS